MTLAFALNAERVLLADSRQPAAAVEPSVPERAGPNLAIRTTRSHKCTTSIPRNPSVPGDVHGRIRATTTWPSKRSCDEKLGCRSFSTVRGYIVHGDVLTVVVSKGRMCVVPTPTSIEKSKSHVSRLRKLDCRVSNATNSPVARHKGSAAVISVARLYFVDLPMSQGIML